MNRFTIKALYTFIAVSLLCALSVSSASAGVQHEIATMLVRDNLTRSENPLSNEGKWAPFGWAASSKKTGQATAEGWAPTSSFPTVDGAYWKPLQFTDMTGSGDGVAVTKENATGSAEQVGAIWLDMPAPVSEQTGYRLAWTQNSEGTFTVKLARFEAGKETSLGEKKGVSIPKGTMLAISDLGESVTGWLGSSTTPEPLITAKDTTFSYGYVGIEGNGSSTRLTNVKASTLGPNPVLENLPILNELTEYDYPFLGGGKFSKPSWLANMGGIDESYPKGWRTRNPTKVAGGGNSGAYWNQATFSSSVNGNGVGINVREQASSLEVRHQAIWLNLSNPSLAKTGYELSWTRPLSGEYEFVLSRWTAGAQTVLASRNDVIPSFSNVYLFDKNGLLMVWVQNEFGYVLQLVAKDSTYLSGYAGFQADDGKSTEEAGSGRLTNFRAAVIPTAATATTESATKVSDAEATLNATVNPNGSNTTYQFEYGTTKGYGNDMYPIPLSVGSGSSGVPLSVSIKGLSPSTTYHFRVVARNAGGTTYSEDTLFTTTPAPSAPVNTGLPVVSPTSPAEAVPEATSNGKWSGFPAPTFTYQWQRCNASGAECVNISGATASSYTPVAADVAHTLTAVVTATNASGSAPVTSKPTETVRQLGQITEYTLPAGSAPDRITKGPEGFWYTGAAGGGLGRITSAGEVAEFSTEGVGPVGIASGAGKIWLSGTYNLAASMTTAGVVTKYTTGKGNVVDATWGPDSRAWFTATGGSLVAITKTGVLTEYALPAETSPRNITAGPDGNLWFTEGYKTNGNIGKSTTAGVVTKYSLPKEVPWDIAPGPDGNVWFTIPSSPTAKIGKMTPAGALTLYSLPGSNPYPEGISPGADGSLWFTEKNASMIGRITPSGTITTYALPAGSEPQDIAQAEDGTLWFTETGTGKIGKIVA